MKVVGRWVSGSLAALQAALAEPRLRRVQLAWMGSTSGEFFSIVALGVFAYEVGGATAVGVVALVQMVPSMLFSPVAGVLGDRLRRELVVVGTDVLRGVTMALAAVAAAVDAPVATVYVLAAVLALGSQAFYPAQTALVPLLARSADDVTAASAASSLIRNAMSLLAPALSGVVLLVADVPVLFALSAVAFTLAALTLLGIGRTDSVRSAPPMTGAFQEVASGFRMAARDRGIALVLGLFAAHGVARGAVGVLLVVVPLELLKTGEAGVGSSTPRWASAGLPARSRRVRSSAAGRSPARWPSAWRRPARRWCSPGSYGRLLSSSRRSQPSASVSRSSRSSARRCSSARPATTCSRACSACSAPCGRARWRSDRCSRPRS